MDWARTRVVLGAVALLAGCTRQIAVGDVPGGLDGGRDGARREGGALATSCFFAGVQRAIGEQFDLFAMSPDLNDLDAGCVALDSQRNSCECRADGTIACGVNSASAGDALPDCLLGVNDMSIGDTIRYPGECLPADGTAASCNACTCNDDRTIVCEPATSDCANHCHFDGGTYLPGDIVTINGQPCECDPSGIMGCVETQSDAGVQHD